MKVYDEVEYKKYVESLTGEYKDCYKKIEGYIKVSFSGNNESEQNCVYAILGELIAAQGSHKPLSMVIGGNIKDYCDKYIELNQAPNARIVKTLHTSALYAGLILIIMLTRAIRIHSMDFAENISFGVLEMVALSYIIFWSIIRLFIVKIAAKNNKGVKNLDIYLNIMFILVLFPIINMSAKLSNFEIKVPFILIIAFVILIALTLIYVNKKRKDQLTD